MKVLARLTLPVALENDKRYIDVTVDKKYNLTLPVIQIETAEWHQLHSIRDILSPKQQVLDQWQLSVSERLFLTFYVGMLIAWFAKRFLLFPDS